MMGIVVPETCWAYKKYNKIPSGIYLVFILQLFQFIGLICGLFNLLRSLYEKALSEAVTPPPPPNSSTVNTKFKTRLFSCRVSYIYFFQILTEPAMYLPILVKKSNTEILAILEAVSRLLSWRQTDKRAHDRQGANTPCSELLCACV